MVRCGDCGCTPCMCGVPGFVTYRGYTLDEAKASVGKGWAVLLDRLFAAKPEETLVVQVKEKFGGLRFYVSSCTREFFALIHAAENESFRVCESCGAPGSPKTPGGNPHGWIKTICDACAVEGNYLPIKKEDVDA